MYYVNKLKLIKFFFYNTLRVKPKCNYEIVKLCIAIKIEFLQSNSLTYEASQCNFDYAFKEYKLINVVLITI